MLYPYFKIYYLVNSDISSEMISFPSVFGFYCCKLFYDKEIRRIDLDYSASILEETDLAHSKKMYDVILFLANIEKQRLKSIFIYINSLN